MCQNVVATFNRLYPGMSVLELCEKGKVRFGDLKVGREGACVNFGLFGRCSGCKYRHEVCAVATSRALVLLDGEGAVLCWNAHERLRDDPLGKHLPRESNPAAPRTPLTLWRTLGRMRQA